VGDAPSRVAGAFRREDIATDALAAASRAGADFEAAAAQAVLALARTLDSMVHGIEAGCHEALQQAATAMQTLDRLNSRTNELVDESRRRETALETWDRLLADARSHASTVADALGEVEREVAETVRKAAVLSDAASRQVEETLADLRRRRDELARRLSAL
jgi:chromosome segregation ATPase